MCSFHRLHLPVSGASLMLLQPIFHVVRFCWVHRLCTFLLAVFPGCILAKYMIKLRVLNVDLTRHVFAGGITCRVWGEVVLEEGGLQCDGRRAEAQIQKRSQLETQQRWEDAATCPGPPGAPRSWKTCAEPCPAAQLQAYTHKLSGVGGGICAKTGLSAPDALRPQSSVSCLICSPHADLSCSLRNLLNSLNNEAILSLPASSACHLLDH